MDLSIREAATILGCTERAVRARLARGSLRGHKHGGRWVIPRDALPLDSEARRRLRDRADDVRSAVEKALPKSLKSLGLTELAPWTGAVAIIRSLDRQGTTDDHRQARADLLVGMARLAEGHHQYHREHKLAAFVGARSAFCHALARVSFIGLLAEAHDIETEVLPPLAGLIRWAERLPGA